MRKLLIIILFVNLTCFYSCSNSISGTEWINVSSDISIEFIDNKKAVIKAGSVGNIDVTYNYDKPQIVISAPKSADMHGVIENDKMTFYNESPNVVFVKK
jgi:hypothetical protein